MRTHTHTCMHTPTHTHTHNHPHTHIYVYARILAWPRWLDVAFLTSHAHMIWRQRKCAVHTQHTRTHIHTYTHTHPSGSSYACPSTHPWSEQDTHSHRTKPHREYREEPIAHNFLFLLSAELKTHTQTQTHTRMNTQEHTTTHRNTHTPSN